MVQNHALQLLCAIGMEPPINSSANAIRDEKLKVLQSLKPWTLESIGQHVIRGQLRGRYPPGPGRARIRAEKGVAPDSTTETFVALRTEIPELALGGRAFLHSHGKRFAGRDAHIVINFRPVPHPIFKTPIGAANRLVITCNPKDGLESAPDGARRSTAPNRASTLGRYT